MSTLLRGVKGAVRNPIRTGGVTVILALSIGLALVMLLSLKAVQGRIDSVKAGIANTISVSPAGARGFEGGGEPLTQAQADQLKNLAHVTSVKTALSDRLTPTTDTSLVSAIDAGSLGRRFQIRNEGNAAPPMGGQAGSGRTLTIPITVTGVTEVNAATLGASSLKFTAGQAINASSGTQVANLGVALATKNNLTVGSTFTAYAGTTFTVAGIYDAGTTFANAGLIVPLATLQALSGQAGQISTATVTADSIDNVSAVASAVTAKLGSAADVTSQQDQAQIALEPLQNIKTISLYSLIGALVAGAVIVFLTMLMIVRERRREIGVLKAIGSSNVKIVLQFVTEAVTLTGLGAVLGVIGGLLLASPVLKLLVSSSSSAVTTGGPMLSGPGGGGGFGRAAGRALGLGNQSLQSLHAVIGYDVLLYGLAATFLIAVIGSALPAFLIAKVRPAEVMRGE
jgi:putative ABC transport system permease protein